MKSIIIILMFCYFSDYWTEFSESACLFLEVCFGFGSLTPLRKFATKSSSLLSFAKKPRERAWNCRNRKKTDTLQRALFVNENLSMRKTNCWGGIRCCWAKERKRAVRLFQESTWFHGMLVEWGQEIFTKHRMSVVTEKGERNNLRCRDWETSRHCWRLGSFATMRDAALCAWSVFQPCDRHTPPRVSRLRFRWSLKFAQFVSAAQSEGKFRVNRCIHLGSSLLDDACVARVVSFRSHSKPRQACDPRSAFGNRN